MDTLQFYFDGEMDVVRSGDSRTYCASQRLKNGRLVLGDGASHTEATSMCISEALKVLGPSMADDPRIQRAECVNDNETPV